MLKSHAGSSDSQVVVTPSCYIDVDSKCLAEEGFVDSPKAHRETQIGHLIQFIAIYVKNIEKYKNM